jgi:hypothetical protein
MVSEVEQQQCTGATPMRGQVPDFDDGSASRYAPDVAGDRLIDGSVEIVLKV